MNVPTDLRFEVPPGVFELRAGAIIINRPSVDPMDARVLMMTNPAVSYAYSIGGAVRYGETIEEAVAREVAEETGHDLPVGPLAAVFQPFFTERDDAHVDKGGNWHSVEFYYWVDAPPDLAPRSDSVGMHGEQESLRWYGLADLDATEFHPAFFADALRARWSRLRMYVERDGILTELG
jgi:8-oxo-dGTP pyrophosphatase MutT (NUDIX family)